MAQVLRGLERVRTLEELRAAHGGELLRHELTHAESRPGVAATVHDDHVGVRVGEVHFPGNRRQRQAQIDFRVFVVKIREVRDQPTGGKGGSRAEMQGRISGVARQPAAGRVELVQGRGHPGKKVLALRGQRDVPRQAVEQLDPEIRLQGFDLVADGRGGHRQFVGGLVKA